jgi:hypothetical protein
MLPQLLTLALALLAGLAAGAPTSATLRNRADSATVMLEGVAKTRCPGGIVPSILTYGPAYTDGPGLLCGEDCFYNGEGTYVSGSESCKTLLPYVAHVPHRCMQYLSRVCLPLTSTTALLSAQ